MPTAAEQRESAMELLRLYAQPDVPPLIGAVALDTILDDSIRATIWTEDTAYIYGAVILPTVRNGHKYRCIQAGTSDADAADEPEWPKGAGGIITEGASDPILTWQEYGPDFENLYDVRRAARQVWEAKAAMASQLYATTQSGSRFDHNQVYDQCIKQAERFASMGVA